MPLRARSDTIVTAHAMMDVKMRSKNNALLFFAVDEIVNEAAAPARHFVGLFIFSRQILY